MWVLLFFYVLWCTIVYLWCSLVAADGSKEEDEELLLALAASMEGIKDTSGVSKNMDISNAEEEMCKTKKPTYPPLPEEPKADRNLLCRVGVRLPDGRRLQRNFLLTEPIQVEVFLLSCYLILYRLPTSMFIGVMKWPFELPWEWRVWLPLLFALICVKTELIESREKYYFKNISGRNIHFPRSHMYGLWMVNVQAILRLDILSEIWKSVILSLYSPIRNYISMNFLMLFSFVSPFVFSCCGHFAILSLTKQMLGSSA